MKMNNFSILALGMLALSGIAHADSVDNLIADLGLDRGVSVPTNEYYMSGRSGPSGTCGTMKASVERLDAQTFSVTTSYGRGSKSTQTMHLESADADGFVLSAFEGSNVGGVAGAFLDYNDSLEANTFSVKVERNSSGKINGAKVYELMYPETCEGILSF